MKLGRGALLTSSWGLKSHLARRSAPCIAERRPTLYVKHGGGFGAAAPLDPPPPWFTTGAGRVQIYVQPCPTKSSTPSKKVSKRPAASNPTAPPPTDSDHGGPLAAHM